MSAEVLKLLQALMHLVIFLGLMTGVLFHSRCVSAGPASSVKEFFVENASSLLKCAWQGALAFALQYAVDSATGRSDFDLLLATYFFLLLVTMSLAFNVGLIATSFAKALGALDQRPPKH